MKISIYFSSIYDIRYILLDKEQGHEYLYIFHLTLYILLDKEQGHKHLSSIDIPEPNPALTFTVKYSFVYS